MHIIQGFVMEAIMSQIKAIKINYSTQERYISDQQLQGSLKLNIGDYIGPIKVNDHSCCGVISALNLIAIKTGLTKSIY